MPGETLDSISSVDPDPPSGSSGERGYPRPMLRRQEWLCLDGRWDFAIDAEATLSRPEDVTWERAIEVPFSPETRRSGVGDTGLYQSVWYRRMVAVSPCRGSDRLVLHFGAVDYLATVWINGVQVAHHEGGYTPFEVDITALVGLGGSMEVVVRAEDDPADLSKPRGKQDWQRDPHSIWYPRTTGIWQTVWLEYVPSTRIMELIWTASLERWEIGLEVKLTRETSDPIRLQLQLSVGEMVLAQDEYQVTGQELQRRVALSDPGIDDFRNELLWSPSSPRLIEARLRLVGERGETVDTVESYCALRTIDVKGGRLSLNGRPYFLRMVLDQGYWTETGLTAPDDQAIRLDVELTKQMGFNGARKHQKIEDPRYLYWADRLGLLVWEEMPSAYRFNRRSVERSTKQWLEVVRRDASHPCIIGWVPFNESWGVPNLPANEAERHYVRTLYHLTKTLDPTRPVIGNDGWESVATDIIGIHDYDDDAERVAKRYFAHEVLPKLLARERPGGRALVLDKDAHADQPIVLSEFGGIAYDDKPSGTWGYSRCESAEELCQRYDVLLAAVSSLELLAGFCYTQFADTYQEANGLLYADRSPKFPLARIRAATYRSASRAKAVAPSTSIDASLTARHGAPK